MTDEDRDLALLSAASETRAAVARAELAEAEIERLRNQVAASVPTKAWRALEVARDNANAAAREARAESARAWAVLTGRDWMQTRAIGSAIDEAERVVAERRALRSQLALAMTWGAILCSPEHAVLGELRTALDEATRAERARDDAEHVRECFGMGPFPDPPRSR